MGLLDKPGLWRVKRDLSSKQGRRERKPQAHPAHYTFGFLSTIRCFCLTRTFSVKETVLQRIKKLVSLSSQLNLGNLVIWITLQE